MESTIKDNSSLFSDISTFLRIIQTTRLNFVKTQIREFKNVPYLTELINTSWFGSWAVINPKLPEAINKIPESNSNLCIAPGVCREWLKNFSPNERSEKSSSWNKCFNFWTHLNLEWASPHVLYQTQILNFNEFFKGQIKSEWIYLFILT